MQKFTFFISLLYILAIGLTFCSFHIFSVIIRYDVVHFKCNDLLPFTNNIFNKLFVIFQMKIIISAKET